MPERFLIFIFAGQLPALVAGMIGISAVAIGLVAFAMKDRQVAWAQFADFGELLQQRAALGFEIFDGVYENTCWCVSVMHIIHHRLTDITCYEPYHNEFGEI